nr:MAG TPA: hypothetical protein [Caudoviricetes sp.]
MKHLNSQVLLLCLKFARNGVKLPPQGTRPRRKA